jgi:predicted Mrr-cat superfamily restriction endonuclease
VTPDVWLIRAGHGAEHADTFVRRGVATLGWASIPGLGDLRHHTDEEILELLSAARRGQPAEDLRELVSFRDAAVGDLVVTPDTPARDLLMGEITGAYDYAPAPVCGDHRHVRPVDWQARCARDLVPHDLAQPTLHYQRTVLQLPQQDEWRHFVEAMRTGGGRPADAPATTRRQRKTREPGPRRQDRVCPSCGLSRSPAMFPGDVCRDCA